MHLTKRVLSFIVAEAIRGNTWAGENVFDSPGDIGSIRVDDEGGIFVAVYCDEWDNKSELVPDETPADTTGTFKIVIEVGAAKPIVGASDDDGQPVTTLAATDQGLEWSIAMISRQCIDTLLDTRPAFAWSDLFQRFISGSLMRFSIRRGGSNNEGKSPAPRYASCVSILKVSVSCNEPSRGQVLPSTAGTYQIWSDLLAMMNARDDLAALAKLVSAHFTAMDGAAISEIQQDAQRMWLSAETMAAIGLAPEASYRFATGGNPNEPMRHDVPLNDADMADWLRRQGPDPSQGGSNAGG